MVSKPTEIPKNKTGGACQTNGKGNTLPFNPHLILKQPIATTQGPFCGGKLPFQCHKCHGWGHTWRNCPTSLNLVLDENNRGPLSQKWRVSQPMLNPRGNQAPWGWGPQIQTTLNSRCTDQSWSWGEGESNLKELGDGDDRWCHNPDVLYRLVGETGLLHLSQFKVP